MDPKIQSVIGKIAHISEMQNMMMEEDRDFVSDDEKVLPVGPETGKYLHELGLKLQAKRIVEVGVSHGYSTLFFADVVKETGGMIYAIEKRRKKIELAQENFAEAGVTDLITLIEGNAKEALKSIEGPVDLVLLDARKDEYIEYFDLILPKLRVGGVIVADNVFHPPRFREIMQKYQDHVRSIASVKSETLSIGKGIEVTEKII